MFNELKAAIIDAINNAKYMYVNFGVQEDTIDLSFIPETIETDGNSITVTFNKTAILTIDGCDITGDVDDMFFVTKNDMQIEF